MRRSIGNTGTGFSGLSTDDKPLDGPEEGARFRIIDTGEVYVFYNGMWELDLTTENDFINRLTTLGTWDNPWTVGNLRVWDDSTTEVIRIKRDSNPESITDGNILMEAF